VTYNALGDRDVESSLDSTLFRMYESRLSPYCPSSAPLFRLAGGPRRGTAPVL